MATHSSILAWRIPWTEEPGGLQSMVWQRVRHDWATNTFTTTFSQGIQKLLPTLVLKYTAYLKITNNQSALVSIIIFVSFPKDRFDSDGISIRNNKFFPSPVSEKKKKTYIGISSAEGHFCTWMPSNEQGSASHWSGPTQFPLQSHPSLLGSPVPVSSSCTVKRPWDLGQMTFPFWAPESFLCKMRGLDRMGGKLFC